LVDTRNITKLAQLMQVVAIANCIISIQETIDPSLISRIAYTLNSNATAFSDLRPAGLWSNPNEAAFAFLFALLISYWARGPLAWMGRFAAIIGIYLTVSRSGMYMMVLCGVSFLLFKLKSTSFTLGRMIILINIFALIVGLCLVLSYRADPLNIDVSGNWNTRRVLDFWENDSREATRIDVAFVAAHYALNGPWHGYGIFAFQDVIRAPFVSVIDVGAHNIYLTVFGETGVLGIFIYLFTLVVGVLYLFKARIHAEKRLIIALMWICYFLIGLVWHNQFTSHAGMIYVGLLYHLPWIMDSRVNAVSYHALPRFE
jgi:O-antigen ligase